MSLDLGFSSSSEFPMTFLMQSEGALFASDSQELLKDQVLFPCFSTISYFSSEGSSLFDF